MRARFGQVAASLLEERADVVLVMAEIGVARLAEQAVMRRHGDRLVNVGIREQAMVGVAAGFALEGFRPIVHSYTPFLIERPFEQIKLDLTHQGVDAVLVSIGGAYDASTEGRTHQSLADVAMMATLPGWQVHVPGHPDELESLMRAAVDADGSTYIRVSARSNDDPFVDRAGQIVPVRRGSPGAPVVFAVGPTLESVLEASRGRDATVAYLATVHPLDPATVRGVAGDATDIVLVESYLAGTSAPGMTAAMSDRPRRLLSIGAPADEIRRYGSTRELERAAGLDAPAIAARLTALLDAPTAA